MLKVFQIFKRFASKIRGITTAAGIAAFAKALVAVFATVLATALATAAVSVAILPRPAKADILSSQTQNGIYAQMQTNSPAYSAGAGFSILLSISSRENFGPALIKIQISNENGIMIRQATSIRNLAPTENQYVNWNTFMPASNGNYSMGIKIFAPGGSILYATPGLLTITVQNGASLLAPASGQVQNQTQNYANLESGAGPYNPMLPDGKLYGSAIIEKMIPKNFLP